ncbi:RNA 2',3'-cyclic phosphodiesterase [Dyella ginsengisoli]|uniref:RNA 2',3'-cyclic phosphodiesterase n=1 Tax=Dyella ginsengisoli TaxID=363848 RepID=A0ABW8JW71_9GAMM
MSDADQPQAGLPGLEEPAGPLHRLFFALVPPEPVREQIAATASALRESGSIEARWVKPARYHLTLAFLGDHPTLRPSLLEAARAAIGKVRVAPFTWLPDQVASFTGRRPPCVLRSTQASPALQTLWEQLRRELSLVRLGGQIERSFTPHVTLAYGQRDLPAPIEVAPIAWPVDRVLLLHSEVGASDYETLGSWRLPG